MTKVKIYPSEDIGDREILYTVCVATHKDVSKSYDRTHRNRGNKRVYMYDKGMSLVGFFRSITEASEAMNVNQSNISRVVDSTTRTAGGYIWKSKMR